MSTVPIYYQDPYKKEVECVVISVEEGLGRLVNVQLDKTIFYPEGGGQPCDKGEIIGPKGAAKVEYVRSTGGQIIHQCLIYDSLSEGDKVISKINWAWRHKYMKIHSAGHLTHDVLMTMSDGLKPLRGSHGKKAFLEYSGSLNSNLKEVLEEKVNGVLEQDLPIITKEVTYEKLKKECQFLPPNLPRTKGLRIIKIGNYPVMPDGGVHVKSTKEIGKILINEVASKEGKAIIKYRVVEVE